MNIQKYNIKISIGFSLIAVLCFTINLFAQTTAPSWLSKYSSTIYETDDYLASQKIFDINSIATIKITMSAQDYISLIQNTSSDTYLLASMTYESATIPLQTIDSVGFRLRGAAVRNTKKKSFKISFRAFDFDDREFNGIRKINLNSDFQDPNLMRSKTCTELFRKMGVAAARVGYAKLYINDEYRGLFANYEEFDKNFLKSRFNNKDGNLYKCPEKATMMYRPNQDYGSTGYYELITNEDLNDYSDLAHFIDILNNTSDEEFVTEIEKVLNIDRQLMWIACNVLLGAWDDYWNLAKNYYFYHDILTGQFYYIPHDYDGSLGTDWYHGHIAHGNPYNWSRNDDRPMVERLLAVPEYRKKYTQYLFLVCSWAFSIEAMEPEIDRTADLIRETLTNDPYWPADHGWLESDFDESLIQAIPRGNVDYGLKENINLRRESALLQLDDFGPFIDLLEQEPMEPQNSDTVHVSAFVFDDGQIDSVKLIYEMGGIKNVVEMEDDDEDSFYTCKIPPSASGVKYYIEATDLSGLSSRLPAREKDFFTYNEIYLPTELFVNEILAKNDSTKLDEYGENDDWFEIYNPNDIPIDLHGMYVTDDLTEPTKWRLNNISIPANGFLLLWADKDPEQGANHVGFKLDKDGEKIGLFETDEKNNALIDAVTFGVQSSGISFGRINDGLEEWKYFDKPTPGRGNTDTTEIEDLVDITNQIGVLTESNNNSPDDETIENIIDNDLSTKYLTFESATKIDFSQSEQSLVKGYSLSSANDAPDRDPNNWEFQAWDENNSEWKTLHKVTNEPRWQDRFQTKYFLFSNVEKYNKYRLDISSPYSGNIIQVSELEILSVTTPTLISDNTPNFPKEFSLSQNYPNPFNPKTTIRYQLPKAGKVNLVVYNISGGEVVTLLNTHKSAGSHQVEFAAGDLSSGIYFYRIQIGSFTDTKKLILLK